MESILGSSARYATANLDAFAELLGRAQMDILNEQRSYAQGTPQVAGGYYTYRHITNAVRAVINEDEDPKTILDYTRTINEEIERRKI